jgi:hypothetical protein
MIAAARTPTEYRMLSPRALISFAMPLLALVLALSPGPVRAAGPSGAQERGAETFLRALASGNPQSVAQEMHPEELEKLRARLLALMRTEAASNDNTYRSRLFGPGRTLADLESMTATRFYAVLSERLRIRVREFQKFKWLAAVPDGKIVYLLGRGEPPKERGIVKVTVTVALAAYGAQWRAVIPSEVEAQIDDLLEGRIVGQPVQASAGGQAATAPPKEPLAPGISELLARAEAALAEGLCEQYYDQYMSPNFNKATSRSARKTLIAACTNSESTRETMITTLRIVQELTPRYDMGGARAMYDLSGQGLPYSRFVLERDKDMRWYIAE